MVPPSTKRWCTPDKGLDQTQENARVAAQTYINSVFFFLVATAVFAWGMNDPTVPQGYFSTAICPLHLEGLNTASEMIALGT